MTSTPETTQATPSKEGKGRYAQEKVMISLVVVFVLGVLVLTFIPKNLSGIVMPLVMTATLFAMFGFKTR